MPLIEKLLLIALLLQVAIPFVVLFRMRFARVRAFKEQQLTMSDIAVNHDAWPVYVRQIQNNYSNQFELPVLFYVACLLAYHAGTIDWVMVILAWIFVLSRWLHMFIHCGSNRISQRFKAFFVGMLCLAAIWVWTAVHILVIL